MYYRGIYRTRDVTKLQTHIVHILVHLTNVLLESLYALIQDLNTRS